MKRFCFPISMVIALGACTAGSPARPAAFSACESVLREQAAAWNRGDIDAFAKGYRKSEHTVFASTSGVSIGYDAMLARYKKRYPDKQAMGMLTFSKLGFRQLDKSHVIVEGRWHLQKAKQAGGRFVLVMRADSKGGYRVALDYTTSD